MPRPLPPALQELLAADSDLKDSTLQGYRSTWRDFLEWAAQRGQVGSPVHVESRAIAELLRPETIAEYLDDRSHLARSTLNSRIRGIRYVAEGLSGDEESVDSDQVQKAWENIRARKREERKSSKEGSALARYGAADVIEQGPRLLQKHLSVQGKEKQARDLKYLSRHQTDLAHLTEEKMQIVPAPEYDLPALRDRALLLLVATAPVSRASLLRLRVEDICPPGTYPDPADVEGDHGPIGVVGHGQRDAYLMEVIPSPDPGPERCPSRALAAWVLAADLTGGPLFRRLTPSGTVTDQSIAGQTVNHVIRRWAERAGLDPGKWTTRRLQG